MATVETWIDCYLNKPVKVQYLDGNTFSIDNTANIFGVNVYNADGTPATLTGTVSANIIRSDGDTVTVNGTKNGNKASVTLPSSAYSVPGTMVVVLKLTNSGTVTGLGAIVTNVYDTVTGAVVDPGTIIPSIEALIAEIDAAVASIPADYSALWATLAPPFSTSTNYVTGQYVTNNGGMYRFTADHSAGSWNASHVTQVDVGGELRNLKTSTDAEISDLKSAFNALYQYAENATPITYTINSSRINILSAFYFVVNGYMCRVIFLKITTSSITSANTWTLGNLSPYANLKIGQSYIDYNAVSLSGGDISGITFRQNTGSANNFSAVTTGAVTQGQGGVIMLTHKQAINDPTKALTDTDSSQKLINDTIKSNDLFNSDFASSNYGWNISSSSIGSLSNYSFVRLRVEGGSTIIVNGLSETLSSYGYAVQSSTGTVLASGGETPGMIIDIPSNGYWLIFTYKSTDTISLIPYKKTNIVVLGDSWSDNDPNHTSYTKWTTLLQQDGRYNVKVYAQNGSWITGDTPNYGQNGNVLGQLEQLKTDNLKNIDTIIIMGGVNDFRGGATDSAVVNKLSYFYSQLNAIYPNARIIYISNNQIYITQQQIDFFNTIISAVRENIGMEAFTSFGWVKANHYISDHVHVDNNGYKDLYANILSILTGGQLHSMKTSYQMVINDDSDNLLFTVGLYEIWDDGNVSYAVKLTVTSGGLNKTAEVTLNAGDGNILASVPFTKIINKAFANSIGLDGAVIYSDVAETFSTTNKMNTSNHIKIITPSSNSGTYLTDNYN